MKRIQNNPDTQQILSVIEDYNTALTLLGDYDHQCMKRPQGNKAIYVLNYEECRKLIDQMRFNADSDLFGHEKDESVTFIKVLATKMSIRLWKRKLQTSFISSPRTTVSVTVTNVSQQLCSSIFWTGTDFSTTSMATNE